MSLQNQVREIVWEQFRALRRVASVKSVAGGRTSMSNAKQLKLLYFE